LITPGAGEASDSMTQIIEWLNQDYISVGTVIGTVVILIVASVAMLVVNRLLRHWLAYLQGRLNQSDETNLIISRIVTAVLWAVTALVAINTWGVSLGGVWAVLVSAITVIGVAFLATWAMISDITASFFLVLRRPLRFGQTVEILPENLKGRVTKSNLMFTTLREDDGNELQIPNNLVFQRMFRVGDQPATPTTGSRQEEPALAFHSFKQKPQTAGRSSDSDGLKGVPGLIFHFPAAVFAHAKLGTGQ
jgi:small-conductance mechanosensitive channel